MFRAVSTIRTLKLRSAAVRRIGLLALDVLDAAYIEANHEPLERTALHRLALGYLVVSGCASPLAVRTLWEVLGHEGVFVQMACRQSHFGNLSHGIRQRIEKLGSAD